MIRKDSRYAQCLLYDGVQGKELGSRRRIRLLPQPDDRFHTVIDSDRIDRLARHYLGDARLWWIIADYNDLFFPIDLTPGSVLRIPSIDHVQMHLLA